MINYLLSCDLETSNIDPFTGDWIHGSFALLTYPGLITVKEIEIFSRPNCWSDESFQVHGIRRDKAEKFQSREDALNELINFLPKERFHFLCHANPNNYGEHYHFDYAFLKMDFMNTYNVFLFWSYFSDELVLSTHTLMKKSGIKLPNYRLNTIADHFGIPLDHHNATSDRKACEKIYRKLIKGETCAGGNLLL